MENQGFSQRGTSLALTLSSCSKANKAALLLSLCKHRTHVSTNDYRLINNRQTCPGIPRVPTLILTQHRGHRRLSVCLTPRRGDLRFVAENMFAPSRRSYGDRREASKLATGMYFFFPTFPAQPAGRLYLAPSIAFWISCTCS